MQAMGKEALRQKYRAERDKRIRADGVEQYLIFQDDTDPHTAVVPREAKCDHVTFAFVGGGWAGLVTGARLVEAGVKDVRIIETGGDFGGAWYWNRYPGAQCDTAAFVYMPLCEETGHMPTEKYAHGPELFAHAQRIGRHYGLYDQALFHTQVSDLVWDNSNLQWTIHTKQGDEFTAQFVGLGTGPLNVPKLPGLPGIESFKGRSFHTSRWDYGYTGGDPSGAPMANLADKRVAIIGTGATAIQVVPHLAAAAKELFVFQRTPSSVDVRNNSPTDLEWFASMATPGWQKRWVDSFTANVAFGAPPVEDLVKDGWTDLSQRIKTKILTLPAGQRTPEQMLASFEDADNEKMSEIRARAESDVKDKSAAENLKAWYRQLCKRPCFHDEYLQAYNRPGVHLVDTDGKGVERITERAVVVAGQSYPVDCIVFASGFEVGTDLVRRTGFDPVGRSGVRLSDKWAQGMRSKHGIHVHGFPNLFIVQPTQGANLIANVPTGIDDSARTIATMMRHALNKKFSLVEVSKEAEDEWVDLLLSGPGRMLGVLDECTPGYYNNEGKGYENSKYRVGYPLGPYNFFHYIREWRESGNFDGVVFSSTSPKSKL